MSIKILIYIYIEVSIYPNFKKNAYTLLISNLNLVIKIVIKFVHSFLTSYFTYSPFQDGRLADCDQLLEVDGNKLTGLTQVCHSFMKETSSEFSSIFLYVSDSISILTSLINLH